MKVIVTEPERQDNNINDSALHKVAHNMQIYTLADTALLTHGKPMFIPDYGGECSALCCLAVRICRLGKSIPERFAYRYFDAFTVGVRFELSDLREKLSQQQLPWDVAVSFDGAATIGSFTEHDGKTEDDCELKLEVAGVTVVSERLSGINQRVAQALSEVSRYYMIRQGDVLFIPMTDKPFRANQDTHYGGCINGVKVLDFNVK